MIEMKYTASALLFAASLAAGPRQAIAQQQPTPAPAAIASWISLSLVQDFGVHSGVDVCSRRSQLEDGYACFRGSGTHYHGAPLPGQGGEIRAVPQPATTRLLLGFDRVIGESFTAGVRLGYVLRGGGPRESGAEAPVFLPFHGEARAGYTFGARPFREAGLRLSLFINAGFAQVDSEYAVAVREDASVPRPVSQLDNPPLQTLHAYKKTGTGFLGGGGAATYAVSRALGFSAGLKVMQMFPSSGTVIATELACLVGF